MATGIIGGVKNLWNYMSGPGKFIETGQLTPEEFVQAGNHLVQVAQKEGWKWMPAVAGHESKSLKDPTKQYLILEGVACEQRAATLFANAGGNQQSEVPVYQLQDQDDEYIVIGSDQDSVPQLVSQSDNNTHSEEKQAVQSQEQSVEAQPAPQTQAQEEQKNAVPVTEERRYYNISICYDSYYYVPHLFLSAVDEEQKPIAQEKIFEDIASESVNKVVTIDPHLATGEKQVSIHPCKHAAVLKMFTELISEGRGQETIGPHLALLIFLKFFIGIAPTIQVDVNSSLEIA